MGVVWASPKNAERRPAFRRSASLRVALGGAQHAEASRNGSTRGRPGARPVLPPAALPSSTLGIAQAPRRGEATKPSKNRRHVFRRTWRLAVLAGPSARELGQDRLPRDGRAAHLHALERVHRRVI